METPLVSISCITYNHALYIRQCLDSFLMQKCDFSFEILIHDDASTDGTQEIIKEYQSKYPTIIFPLIQSENQYSKGVRGMMPRFNFPRARGKYIALCEGDDFWTDMNKLQEQVDFLENNSNYIAIADNSYWLDVKSEKKHVFNTIPACDIDINMLVKKRQFATASVVYRNSNIPFDTSNNIFGDTFLFGTLMKYGLFHYRPKITSVYRRHAGGVTNTKKIIWAEEMEKWNKKLHSLFPEIDYAILREKNLVEFRSAAVDALHNKRTRDYLYCSFKCIWYKPGPGFKFFYTNLSDWISSKFNRK